MSVNDNAFDLEARLALQAEFSERMNDVRKALENHEAARQKYFALTTDELTYLLREKINGK